MHVTDAQRAEHERLWRERELYEPVEFLADAVTRWRERHGLPPFDADRCRATRADLWRGKMIAMMWERLPDRSRVPLVREAYRQLVEQTEEMWRFAVEELGMCCATTVEPGIEPYATGAEQAAEIVRDRRIITETGLGKEHPLMTREQYDMFRAVHDLFGHAALGTGFDRHGEYQAFLSHCAMYFDLGRWAMASEYRGVNSSLWAGHAVGAGKAALLPRGVVFA